MEERSYRPDCSVSVFEVAIITGQLGGNQAAVAVVRGNLQHSKIVKQEAGGRSGRSHRGMKWELGFGAGNSGEKIVE